MARQELPGHEALGNSPLPPIMRLSLHAIIGLTVGLMGLLGLVLALATGTLYRNLALEDHREYLGHLIHQEVQGLLEEQVETSSDLGMALQADPDFRAAYDGRELETLQELLGDQYQQYFFTANVLHLESLVVLDAQLQTIARANHPELDTGTSPLCPQLLSRAMQRSGVERTKVLALLCVTGGLPHHAALIPIGSLSPRGYLAVVTSPVLALAPSGTALYMPLRIEGPEQHVLYQSPRWPLDANDKSLLHVRYKLSAADRQTALSMVMVKDVSPFLDKLRQTRERVIWVAGIASLLAAAFAFYALRFSTLNPLATLSEQLHRVRADPRHLQGHVAIGGTREICNLAQDFNVMADELNRLYDSLEDMAFRDTLTQLPNRNLLHDYLSTLTHDQCEGRHSFALMLMDLDRFKTVNDTLGHHVGDDLLKLVSERFRSVLRATDILSFAQRDSKLNCGDQMIARIGGDEFAVVLPDVDKEQAAALVADKLIKVMEEDFELQGQRFSVGVSIGIALFPTHGNDMHTLMRQADVAMYHAKNTRRGYAFYEEILVEQVAIDQSLERDLRDAIDADILDLHFQPQVNGVTGQVCGAEALIRWPSVTRGFVPPDQFMPLAERIGLIQPLTTWILRRALDCCANWRRQGYSLGVSVNLSAVNLHDPNLVPTVLQALKDKQVPPELLTLELTETSVMSDPDFALDVLGRLHAMGAHLSIDDFGTGYSSLAYVKKMPVQEIKIDRSFIFNMINDSNDEAIVRSTIALAHNMGLRVVAEGVEDNATRNVLSHLHCDVMQGYLFARPMPESEYLEWLARHYRKDRKSQIIGAS